MTVDTEKPNDPAIPLVDGEEDGMDFVLELDELHPHGMGEEDMMSFICTHIGSILKPYADNVYELHKTVEHLSSTVNALQEKQGLLDSNSHAHAARMDGMQEGQDKLMQLAESTRQFLDGFIDDSGKKEQERDKTIQNLEETLTLAKSDIAELQKNGEDMRTKLVACQDAEKENRENCVQLKNELHRVADNLKIADEGLAASIKKVDFQISVIQNKQNKELAQEQTYLRAKFIALNDQSTDKWQSLNERFAENQSQLKQYRKEFEQVRDATAQALLGIKGECLSLVRKETQKMLDKVDADLRSQIRDLDTKGKDLDYNLNQLLKTQGEKQEEEMKDVRGNLGDLQALTSKHESEVDALQRATLTLPGRVKHLEGENDFGNNRSLRLEKAMGLEPMTKEMADPKRALKKRASSAMLIEDQLLRKAWSAWRDAIEEAKQNQVSNVIPDIQEMLKVHRSLIDSEKSKLDSTHDRVQSLEVDHTKLLQELQKLRKSLDLNDGHWRGMTRGLQSLKKAMHTEGEGEIVHSAARLRDALPPVTSSATARPATSMM